MGSVASLNFFRKKDKSDWDHADALHDGIDGQEESDKREFGADYSPRRRSRYGLKSHFTSQSMSATNGLAALRISTPNTSLRQSIDTGINPHVAHPINQAPLVRPASPLSPPYSTTPTSTPESSSPRLSESQPVFLSLPPAESSFDTFNVNTIDFTKLDTKVELPPKQLSPTSKRITNHDFIFLIDDGPGIDHRAWDTICDLVYGVTKRLVPQAAKEQTPQLSNLPPESPNISIRFINNPRNISRVQTLNQIRNIFNWVTPRDTPKFHRHHPSAVQKPPPHIPPLRILEYYFWNIYTEKLQKNAWVGQNPTTIVAFISSPLGNRQEDMDLFVAKCAERLNTDQVPLPLISILVVQCNTDPSLHRQLVETRRMITWEWYTPKPKLSALPTSPGLGNRNTRQSMLNPNISEPRRRPQRDWVDIITCVDWERAGGLPAIKGMIEEEIQKGTQRRKKLQKEVAMNYLSNLGKKENQPSPKVESKPMAEPIRQTDDYEPDYNFMESYSPTNTQDAKGYRETVYKESSPTEIRYPPSPDSQHNRGQSSLGFVHAGRGIQYYD